MLRVKVCSPMLASHVPCLPTIQNFTCTLSTSYPNPHSEQQPESHPALSKATQQTATTTTSCSSAKCLSRDNCPAPTADATGFEPLHSCLTSTPRFPSSGRLGELIQHGEIQDLPSPLPLNGNLPTRAKLGSIVHDVEASAMNVHKIFHFAEKFAVCRGLELCTGNAYIPVFRQGPWALRKAIQHLLERLPGCRLLWITWCRSNSPFKGARRHNELRMLSC